MEPPWAIVKSKRSAEYRFTLAIEDVAVMETSTTALERCRAAGIVEKVHRRPLFRSRNVEGAPRRGERFAVSVWCWNETRQPGPPGPARLDYGGPRSPKRILVWGSLIDDEFVVHQFERMD